MSDLTSYYQGESHEALYTQLGAGDPASVTAASDHWGIVESTLDGISTALTRDLASLNERWSSDSGDEFTSRVQTVVDFAADNSRGAGYIKTSLASFATELKAAQAKVDDPADTNDNDSATGGTLIGAAVLGVPGAVIGNHLGQERDKEQREKAKARTVELIAGLASNYQMDWSSGGIEPPAPPAKLPGSVSNDGAGDTRGPGATGVGSVTGTGTSTGTGTGTKSAPDSPSLVSETGDGDGGGGTAGTSPSTSLAGVSGGSGGGGGTGTIGGVTPGTSGGGGGGGGGGDFGGSGLALGGLAAGAGGLAAGALGLNSGQSGRPGTGGAGSANPASAARPGTGGVGSGGAGSGGAGSGKGAGTGSTGSGAGGLGKDKLGVPRQGAGVPGMDGHNGLQNNRNNNAAGARGAAGGRGLNGEEDEADEHTTWLTEDDMVWGQDGSAPPPVLGGR